MINVNKYFQSNKFLSNLYYSMDYDLKYSYNMDGIKLFFYDKTLPNNCISEFCYVNIPDKIIQPVGIEDGVADSVYLDIKKHIGIFHNNPVVILVAYVYKTVKKPITAEFIPGSVLEGRLPRFEIEEAKEYREIDYVETEERIKEIIPIFEQEIKCRMYLNYLFTNSTHGYG